ncbi:MAG TPA: alpha/beta hydrolase, partial [Armatimonadota bacterium]|nr:alpha/beta hydrolase [Armatimonadota bacterium]
MTDLILEEGALPAGASANGGRPSLFRRTVRPAGPAWARVGVLHGYGDHGGRYGHFMRWLAERGVACHAVDFRGHGNAGGRRGFVSRWEEFLEDLREFLACDPVAAEFPETPLFLVGHSHGGLVLAAAGEAGLDGVAGCVFSAPYLRGKMRVPGYKTLAARVLDPVLPWLRISNGLRSDWMSSDPEMLEETGRDPLVLHTATPRWYLTCLRAQAEVLQRAPRFRQPLLMLVPEADPVADPQ